MRLALATLLLATLPAQSQDEKAVPPPKPVTIPVVVRDHKGLAIEGLTATNFSIKVDDTPQPILAITRGTATPVTIGLVVDVGNGQRNAIESERQAARTLLTLLRPGDQMFVIQFAKQIELLQPPTADKPKLEKALAELGTSSPTFTAVEPTRSTVDEEGRKVRTGGTSLDDAVFLASDEVLAKATTKRVLIVLSDGIDVGSKTTMSELMETVQQNNVIVYGMYSRNVDATTDKPQQHNGRSSSNPGGGTRPTGSGGYPGGISFPGGYPSGGGSTSGSGTNNPNGPGSEPEKKPRIDGAGALKNLSEKTGGRLFETGKKSTLEDNFAAVADDLHSLYWLTFTPAGTGTRHGYHPFDLLVAGSDKSKKVDIQTSEGFVGGT